RRRTSEWSDFIRPFPLRAAGRVRRLLHVAAHPTETTGRWQRVRPWVALAPIVAVMSCSGASSGRGHSASGVSGVNTTLPAHVAGAAAHAVTVGSGEADPTLGDPFVAKACGLLTAAEIQAQFGGPVGPPTPTWPYCQWIVGGGS